MTRKLEELLNLPPMEDSENFEDEPKRSREEIIAESVSIVNSLSISEKIDASLTTVTGLLQHDDEMDEIAAKALASYKDLVDLGMNVPDMHAGKIYEVAATMLKTAMEARDAKVNKKLKMLDMQIKKLRVDKMDNTDSGGNSDNDVEFDRNELLAHIIENNKNNVDTDK